MSERRRIWKSEILLAAVAVISLVLLFNINTILLLAAVVFSEKRPALLRDAEWNNPDTALRFNDKFAPGVPEEDLVEWLDRNRFAVDRTERRAERQIAGLPCNETIRITWKAEEPGKLRDAEATVSEAGCL
jgi:hypothetical protein